MRVWPLCFAIAIEKSQRVRPTIMVAASSLLAGIGYHLQESDTELAVRHPVRQRAKIVFPRVLEFPAAALRWSRAADDRLRGGRA